MRQVYSQREELSMKENSVSVTYVPAGERESDERSDGESASPILIALPLQVSSISAVGRVSKVDPVALEVISAAGL